MKAFIYPTTVNLNETVEDENGTQVSRFGQRRDQGTQEPHPEGFMFDRLDPTRIIKPIQQETAKGRWQDDFYGGPAPMSGAVVGGVDYARPSID